MSASGCAEYSSLHLPTSPCLETAIWRSCRMLQRPRSRPVAGVLSLRRVFAWSAAVVLPASPISPTGRELPPLKRTTPAPMIRPATPVPTRDIFRSMRWGSGPDLVVPVHGRCPRCGGGVGWEALGCLSLPSGCSDGTSSCPPGPSRFCWLLCLQCVCDDELGILGEPVCDPDDVCRLGWPKLGSETASPAQQAVARQRTVIASVVFYVLMLGAFALIAGEGGNRLVVAFYCAQLAPVPLQDRQSRGRVAVMGSSVPDGRWRLSRSAPQSASAPSLCASRACGVDAWLWAAVPATLAAGFVLFAIARFRPAANA